MEEKYEYEPEVYQRLGDAIVWTTILAATHSDGVIEVKERAEAIKQAHIRSFSSEDYIKPIYEHLDEHFERDFDAYIEQLPKDDHERDAYIRKKLEESTDYINKMGPVFASQFSADLKSLFNRVFNANATVMQSFLLPFISSHLEDRNNPNK